jgi:hypothetical protein
MLLPLPNIRPQPRIQKPIELIANTTKFFERILTQFLARHMPDSTQANPRFMKNTSMPVIKTQSVSAITFSSAVVGPAGAAAGAGGAWSAVLGAAAGAAAASSAA